MLRTRIRVRDRTFYLAQGHGLAQLQSAIVDAIKAGGGFVRFTEVGNRNVSVLISPGVSVVLEEEDIPADDRDTGDERHPFTPSPDGLSFVNLDYFDYS